MKGLTEILLKKAYGIPFSRTPLGPSTVNPPSPPVPPTTNNAPIPQPTNVNSQTSPTGNYMPASSQDIANAEIRLKILRYLDDGLQTLGVMQVYDENGNELYELETLELPWRDNENAISCIPTGKYLVRPRNSSTQWLGKHFHIIGSEANNYKYNKLTGNGYTRDYVLIHTASTSSHLMGCIGVGETFNSVTKGLTKKGAHGAKHLSGNKQGNPRGFESWNDSVKAMNRLRNILWKKPFKNHQFYLTIENSPSLTDQLSPSELTALGFPPTIGT